jgi:hypothetical protein
MVNRAQFLGIVVAFVTVFIWSSLVGAEAVGQGGTPLVQPSSPALASVPAAGDECSAEKPYGMALTPAVYLVNFMLLYSSSPAAAANMPAYRALIPAELYDCLKQYPTGCPYAEHASDFENQPFDDGAFENRQSIWPGECQIASKWEQLTPKVARRADQINEPLGMKRAQQLAKALGMTDDMVLTADQYACTIGMPPRNQDQEIIYSCINNLTNSTGNTDIPLAGYGLSITDAGLVQSDCAPGAPCLVFNDLFAGPLEKIALQCGWASKLALLFRDTNFLQYIALGHSCQQAGGAGVGACVIVPVSPGKPRAAAAGVELPMVALPELAH